jgi:O-methyltransferase
VSPALLGQRPCSRGELSDRTLSTLDAANDCLPLTAMRDDPATPYGDKSSWRSWHPPARDGSARGTLGEAREILSSLPILLQALLSLHGPGKALLTEHVIKPSNQPDFAKWLDLNMLVILPGRERTAEEFRDLYAAAGFRLSRIIPAGGLSIVEGVSI